MKKYVLAVTAFLISATPALAHHPLAGAPMETFAHGILSGIGHPLLGFDHLFFVIVVGVAALLTGYAKSAPAAYISAMIIGCLAMSMGIGLPMKELIIGLSLLIVGGVVLSGRAPSLFLTLSMFAGFGLFHGSAFGNSIAGQEAGVGSSVLIGYLIGLAVLQYAIAVLAGFVMSRFWKIGRAHV